MRRNNTPQLEHTAVTLVLRGALHSALVSYCLLITFS